MLLNLLDFLLVLAVLTAQVQLHVPDGEAAALAAVLATAIVR